MGNKVSDKENNMFKGIERRQSGSGKVKEGEEVRELVIAQMIQVRLVDDEELGFSSEYDGDQSLEACEWAT